MLPDRVSNPGPLTYESDALPIALHGPASLVSKLANINHNNLYNCHNCIQEISYWPIYRSEVCCSGQNL